VQLRFDREAIQPRAVAELAWQRQVARLDQRRRFAQRLDAQHQRAGVVLPAPGVRGLDQMARGKLGLIVQLQQAMQFELAQRLPRAVADQHEHIACHQIAVAEIGHDVDVEPQRAFEHMRHARRFPDVIGRQLHQAFAAQAIQTAVADVRVVIAMAAQGQRRQRRRHAAGFVPRRGLAGQPAVDRGQHRAEGMRNFPGIGRRVKIGQ
jgi:hypothetical protein